MCLRIVKEITRKATSFKFLRLNCSDITQVNIKMRIKISATVRPILDAVQKQGVMRIFHHGLVRLGTPLF